MNLSNEQIELLKHISEWGCDGVWCGGEKGNYEGTPCPFSYEGNQCIVYTNTNGDREAMKKQARELLYQQEVSVMSDTSKLAYPVTETNNSGQIAPTHLGMTLREYYAGLAMQGLLQNGLYGPCVAIEAVEYADALITALQEGRK